MHIGIFGKKHQPCLEQVRTVFATLSQYPVRIYIHQPFLNYLRENLPDIASQCEALDEIRMDIELAISIGGDGSFLRTASIVGRRGIPILGVNTGRLGFLADVTEKNILTTFEHIFQGNMRVDYRMALDVIRTDSLPLTLPCAINEVAILKQDTAAMLTIHAEINGEYLTSYQSDGLIIATPTGSTAYALSVGGPIMSPNTKGLILAPVAPHSLNLRPIVVSDDSIINLRVESRNNSFLISTDGNSKALDTSVELEIKRADFSIAIAQTPHNSFFKTLQEKLLWGADTRGKK